MYIQHNVRLFFKLYKPKSPSLRHKITNTSYLSSIKILKNLKNQFFKKKLNGSKKFLSNTNTIYKLDDTLCGSSLLVSWFKVSYRNSYIGAFEYFDSTLCYRQLPYGFSYTDIYENFFFKKYMKYHIFKRLKFDFFRDLMQRMYIFIFDMNYKFFGLQNKTNTYAVSAGTFCFIKNKNFLTKLLFVKLPSKKCLFFDFMCLATVGRVSNIYSMYTVYGSFSKKNNLKCSGSKVRGIAKNPVDHPNGGRSKIKQPFKNPWGCIAKRGK